jgi:tetratricopeptide (TPR) repeat protein
MTDNDDPRIVKAINHALDLHRRGKTGLAVKHLLPLIMEFPRTSSIRGYLALFLSLSGRFDEAIEHGRRAILLSPKSEKASVVFFGALWKSGRRTEALDEAKRFSAIRPSEEYSKMLKELGLSVAEQ